MAVLKVLDYIIIITMLLISAGIGIYFGFFGSKQKASLEYFRGSKQLGVLPVAASIVVTVQSAIAYVGQPAEVYIYGPYYGLFFVARIVASLVVTISILPVFYRLGVTSIFEYLNLRFNKPVRYCVVILQLFSASIYMGVVVYIPALALSTITEISLTTSILTVGITCTFYTSIGGMKAIVWTDVFQAFIMTAGMLVMIIVGSAMTGGPAEGWKRAVEGERGTLVNFDPDITIVYSFWSIMIGYSLVVTSVSSKQQFVQRYNSCKTEVQAKAAAWIGICTAGVVDLLSVAMGMTIFAYYAYCDPLTSGSIDRPDQLVPYFIVDVFKDIPGLPGFLIAGAFAASMSSMSSLVNGIAAVIGQDFIKPIWKDISDTNYTYWVKAMSLLLGGVAIAVAFLASSFGGVLQAVISYSAIFDGPGFAIFCLGMFFPRANSIGSIFGLVSGVSIGLIIKIGSGFYEAPHSRPPLTACPVTNYTTISDIDYVQPVSTVVSEITFALNEEPAPQSKFFSMSFLYYYVLTVFSTILIGYVVSLLTKNSEKHHTDTKLFTPVARYYPKRLIPSDIDFANYFSNQKTVQIDEKVDKGSYAFDNQVTETGI